MQNKLEENYLIAITCKSEMVLDNYHYLVLVKLAFKHWHLMFSSYYLCPRLKGGSGANSINNYFPIIPILSLTQSSMLKGNDHIVKKYYSFIGRNQFCSFAIR